MNAPLNLVDTQAEAFAQLAALIQDSKIALLTSVTTDGTLHSRPLLTREVDRENTALWFLAASNFSKAGRILHDKEVALAYVSADRQNFASVSGRAQVVHDKIKALELWDPMAATRFPKSVDDPRLVLLRVNVTAIEFWDAP
jgi:general stress protein 26